MFFFFLLFKIVFCLWSIGFVIRYFRDYMDPEYEKCVLRMIKQYIEVVNGVVFPLVTRFASHRKVRHQLNQLMSKKESPVNEDMLLYFDTHPLLISTAKIKTVLCKSIAQKEIDFNLLLFALFMADELFEHQSFHNESEKRNELMFAAFPYIRNLSEHIEALY